MALRHLVFMLGLCSCALALGQELSLILVNEDRPLAYVTRELSKQLGVTITFEEMEFEHPDDFHEVEWRSETLVVPRGGAFRFEYDPTRPVAGIVDSLLSEYHKWFPGNYRVIEETFQGKGETQTIFHIIPDSSKNPAGIYVPRRSVLDVPVSLHLNHPAYLDTLLCAVIEQASELQDEEIGCLSESAYMSLGRVLFEYHAENVPARTLLLRLLEESGHHVSWFTLRGSRGDYAVSFYEIRRNEPATE